MDVQLKADAYTSAREGHGSAASSAMSHRPARAPIGSRVGACARLVLYKCLLDSTFDKNIEGCLKSQEWK